MRPKKLIIRGFITYKDTVTIDFDKLFDKKIFLISGDTGSGKTSIFDAISFALYGKVARNISTDRLRSDYLNESDPYTFVSLDFEVSGNTYRIERIPRQVAKKSKPYQDISNSVVLYDISGEIKLISEKINETDVYIKKIIGLDDKQFSKVMLLAQGQFQEFLSAKSADKASLLGDIFKTYEYKNFQEKIKDYAKDSLKEMDYIDKELENIISYDKKIEEKVNRDDILTHDFENIKETLGIEENNFYKIYDEKSQNLKEIENKIIEVQKNIENSKEINKKIDVFNDIEKELKIILKNENKYLNYKEDINLSDKANSISFYEKRLKDNKIEIESLKEILRIEKENLKHLKDKFFISKERTKLLNDLEKEKDIDKENLKDVKDSIKSLENYLDIKKIYFSVESFRKKLLELNLKKDGFFEKKDDLRENIDFNNDFLTKLNDDKNVLTKKIYELEKEIITNEEDYKKLDDIEKSKKKLNDLEVKKEIALEDEKKAIVNEDLIFINKFIDRLNDEGICPVCGSHHSKKVEKYQIETFDLEKIRKKLSDIKSNIELQNENLEKNLQVLNTIYDLDKLSEKIKEKKKEKDKLVEKEKSIDKDLSYAKKKKNYFNKELEYLKDKINNTEEEIKILNKKVDQYQNIENSYLSQKNDMEKLNINTLLKSKKFIEDEIKSKEDSISEIREIYKQSEIDKNNKEKEVENIENNLENLLKKNNLYDKEFKEKINEYFTSFEEYKIYLNNLKKNMDRKEEIDNFFDKLKELKTKRKIYLSYKDKEKVDIEKIENELEDLNTKKEEISFKKNEFYTDLNIFKKTLERINELEEKYNSNRKESNSLAKLSKVANGLFGKIKGREKIDFESFVLTFYFDKVLNLANIRLLDMTDGQFSMIRNSNTEDFRTKSGLDIEILDANTGKLRPVSTLSGGESFLASLSLALGLSDEISIENGGVKIDTLFIDEGFGTLSKDYLRKVISAIEKLSYENKFIGLISHVDDLKDAIDAKILVSYDSSKGSEVKLIL
ncbi:MAG: AAA family ATPase [Peptoniphilaceae bacterium]|nr:AAA family ATPase [Peptoniphilaceae bacterium]MDD7383307.1 AAA family ATPase [Peptoniphilaceae bacterium]MDY3738322.1 AAA family ATPase [Peptoniphilaceae bacterium]